MGGRTLPCFVIISMQRSANSVIRIRCSSGRGSGGQSSKVYAQHSRERGVREGGMWRGREGWGATAGPGAGGWDGERCGVEGRDRDEGDLGRGGEREKD